MELSYLVYYSKERECWIAEDLKGDKVVKGKNPADVIGEISCGFNKEAIFEILIYGMEASIESNRIRQGFHRGPG